MAYIQIILKFAANLSQLYLYIYIIQSYYTRYNCAQLHMYKKPQFPYIYQKNNLTGDGTTLPLATCFCLSDKNNI